MVNKYLFNAFGRLIFQTASFEILEYFNGEIMQAKVSKHCKKLERNGYKCQKQAEIRKSQLKITQLGTLKTNQTIQKKNPLVQTQIDKNKK